MPNLYVTRQPIGRLSSGSLPIRIANTFGNSLSTGAAQHSANLRLQAEGYKCSTGMLARRENQTKMIELVAYFIKLKSVEFPLKFLHSGSQYFLSLPKLHFFSNS